VAAVLRDGLGRLPVGLSPHRWKVLRALLACRTGVLGGQTFECRDCHRQHFVPFACGNRHCPNCQGHLARQWLKQQQERLLPAPYFHLVFTLPHALHPLIRQNLRPVGDLLFAAVSQTLLQFGRERLGAVIGLTMVLHTWGQTLGEHYHVHVIATGGGLGADGTWKAAPHAGYLFPVHALSQMFRGKFCAGLGRLWNSGKLKYHGALGACQGAAAFSELLHQATRKDWNVHIKRPFAGPETVLKYLSHYTHRIAISPRRLQDLDLRQHRVTFQWRDYAKGSQLKPMTLDTGEFARRFCLHILPQGFAKVRHFGLLANRGRDQRLQKAREALAKICPKTPKLRPERKRLPDNTTAREPLAARSVAPSVCVSSKSYARSVAANPEKIAHDLSRRSSRPVPSRPPARDAPSARQKRMLCSDP